MSTFLDLSAKTSLFLSFLLYVIHGLYHYAFENESFSFNIVRSKQKTPGQGVFV